MSNNRQLNYVNDLQNRDQKLYYVDDVSELNSINLEENDKIYAINDNKLFQMEIADQEEELSGSIVSFNGRNNTKIKSLVANIEPVQDLHGYSSPWPAGGGKNKFDKEYLSNFTNYTNLRGSYSYTDKIQLKPNTAYIIKAADLTALSSGIYYVLYHIEGSDPDVINITSTSVMYPVYNGAVSSAVAYMKFTTGETGVIRFGAANATALAEIMTKDWQLEEGSTATAWSPYENICPIIGHTGCNVARTGFNMWDEEWENGTFNTTTGANINTGAAANQIRTKNLIPIKPSATYHFKAPSGIWCIFYDANKNVITPPSYDGNVIAHDGNSLFLGDSVRPASVTFTMPSNAYFMKFYCQNVYGSTYNNDISINYPATDTEYHPYTGNQISVTFPTTIYGGTHEVITGKLKSTMAMVDLGTLNWTYASSGGRSLFTSFDLKNRYKTSGSNTIPVNAMFECYLNVAMNSTFKNGEAGLDGNISSRIVVCDNRYTDADSFKAAMSGIHLCYELAEPVEYTLTENEVETLYGTNNIWADTGDITVKIAEKGITAFELEPYT